MAIEWDPITFVNLVLCIIVVVLGGLCYRKSGEYLPLLVAAAFLLFGFSHAATLAGFRDILTLPLIAVRTLAYLLVVVALWHYLGMSRIPPGNGVGESKNIRGTDGPGTGK